MSAQLLGPHLASKQAPRRSRSGPAPDEFETPGGTRSQVVTFVHRHDNEIATLLGLAIGIHGRHEPVPDLDRPEPTFAINEMAIALGLLDGGAQESDPTRHNSDHLVSRGATCVRIYRGAHRTGASRTASGGVVGRSSRARAVVLRPGLIADAGSTG